MVVSLSSAVTYAQTDSSRSPMTVQWSVAGSPEGTSITLSSGIPLKISGIINAGYESTFQIGDNPLSQVAITVQNPAQKIVYIDQVYLGCAYDQCFFDTEFTLGGIGFDYTGLYTITAQYKKQTATADFPFISSPKQTGTISEPLNTSTISVDWRFENGKPKEYSTITGDAVMIYGQLNLIQTNDDAGFVAMEISNPDGITSAVDQIKPTCGSSGCTFETRVNLDGPYFEEPGVYVVDVCYAVSPRPLDTYCAGTSFNHVVMSETVSEEHKDTTSNQVLRLQEQNNSLKQEISSLKLQVAHLEDRIKNLNEIVSQQMQVIYQWVVSK
ncbi:MAG: hypothetical protein ACW9W4_01180 [Candidatus Nitrosopumilus sp. bin_7KS]